MTDIGSIMTESVRTIHRDTYVSEVAGIFEAEGIGGAPLVDDIGGNVGIITNSDIAHFEFIGGDPFTARAWEIANPSPITVDITSSIEEAARVMLEHHVHHLIVVDGARSVGFLSSLDFVELVSKRISEL